MWPSVYCHIHGRKKTEVEEEEDTTKTKAKGKGDKRRSVHLETIAEMPTGSAASEPCQEPPSTADSSEAPEVTGPSTSRRYRRLRKQDAVPFIMDDGRDNLNRSKKPVSWCHEPLL